MPAAPCETKNRVILSGHRGTRTAGPQGSGPSGRRGQMLGEYLSMTCRAVAIAIVVLLAGCAQHRQPAPPATPKPAPQAMSMADAMRLIDHRPDWTARPPIDVPRDPSEKFLKDLCIVIDPGHGGEDGGAISTRP